MCAPHGVREAADELRPILEEIVPLPQKAAVKTRGEAAWLLAAVRVLAGDRGGARALLQESLALAREAEDLRATALSLSMLGAVTPTTKGADGAWQLNHEALAIARRLEWRWGIAYILHHLGDTAMRDRDAAAAIAFDTECLAIAREIENEPLAAMALWQLGWGHVLQGDQGRAQDALAESATLCLRLHSIENMSYCLDGFAGVAMARGEAGLAARLAGAADAARDTLRMEAFPPLAGVIDAFRAPARETLGEEAFTAQYTAGAEMSAEAALAQVLARPEQADGKSADVKPGGLDVRN